MTATWRPGQQAGGEIMHSKPCIWRLCYRRRESAHRWRRTQPRGGQPSTTVAEHGRVATPQQGLCCHEAGHAVVAFSLGVRVVAVSVFFTEKEGWKGDTKTEGTDHLPGKDQIVLRIAGMAAEEFFNCPEDPRASLHDR